SVTLIFVPNVGILLAARVLSGFTNSALVLCASVIVADANRANPRARDRGYSRLQTFNSVGAASGLAIGAAAAGLGVPALYFAVVTGYGLLILALCPVLVRRLPPTRHIVEADAPESFARRFRTLRKGVFDVARQPSTVWLLLASTGIGWVIQSGHYGLSLVLADVDPDLGPRILLSILIPVGVFIGSSLNQMSIVRMPAAVVLTRAYLFLPLACLAYALAIASGSILAEGAALVVLGVLTGMLMPLGPAVIVSWFPSVRGSATAAESVAKSIGSTVSPILLGVTAAAWGLPVALGTVAVVAVLGAIASRGILGFSGGSRPVPSAV
ncbi:MAG TPA: MFS transporter, partial [Pseudolysinimonas sp.]|nr:MFS transporter [Pseudolysinimonas sp.]